MSPKLALILALGGYVAFVICMRAKEWRKNKEARMHTVYFPRRFPMELLAEFAKQHGHTLNQVYGMGYTFIKDLPDDPEEPENNVVPLRPRRDNEAPKGAA